MLMATSETNNSDTQKLFSENVPDDKRLGILRTFHHKMYKDEAYPEEKKSFLRKCVQYYCTYNRGACLVILIASALIIVGILSICYGFMMPRLYKRNELLKPEEEKEYQNYLYYKDIFIISGIGMIGFGMVCSLIGIFLPWYRDKDNSSYTELDSDCVRTPIVVDYELPPYDTALHAGNYTYEDSSPESTPESYCSESTGCCESPIENEAFKTFFVQSDNKS